MNNKSTLASPYFTSKKVDDKMDIFTSRWEEAHVYNCTYLGMFSKLIALLERDRHSHRKTTAK